MTEGVASGIKGQRGKILKGKEANAVHIVSGTQIAAYRLGTIDDDDVRSSPVLMARDDREQISDLDPQPGLLPTFPHCSLRRRLAKINETTRERPQALAWGQAPPNKKDATVTFHDHAGSHLMFSEDDPLTGGAEAARTPKGLPRLQRVTAAGTVVQLEGSGQTYAPRERIGAIAPAIDVAPASLMERTSLEERNPTLMASSHAVAKLELWRRPAPRKRGPAPLQAPARAVGADLILPLPSLLGLRGA